MDRLEPDPAYTVLLAGIATRLAQTVAALGITKAEAARVMGVSPQRLNGWLAGKHPPDLLALHRLHQRHRVTLDWLVLGDPSGLPQRIVERLVR